MKIVLNIFFFLFLLIGNAYSKKVNLDCKIFISDTRTVDKSWSLDSVKKNYWSKFTPNTIRWVEVVLPEHTDDKNYAYTYFEVNRTSGILKVEFSVHVKRPIGKNHKKLKIDDTIYGQCKKGNGEKLF